MVAFSIASLNVDGIRDDDKRARIFEYLKSLKYDFFLLQETHIQTEDIEAWSTKWGGPCFWSPGSNKSRGVGIVSMFTYFLLEALGLLQDLIYLTVVLRFFFAKTSSLSKIVEYLWSICGVFSIHVFFAVFVLTFIFFGWHCVIYK